MPRHLDLLQVFVEPELKRRIMALARSAKRSASNWARLHLEEAVLQEETKATAAGKTKGGVDVADS